MPFGIRPWAAGPYAELAGFDPTNRMSAFNFCDPYDHILPPSNGTISEMDRQHLWGMYVGIAADITRVGPPRGSLLLLGVGI